VHPGHMLRALMTKKKKKDLGSRFAPGPYFLLKYVRMPFFLNRNTLTYFSPAFVSQKTNGVLRYVFTV
jgi:hypothetical protein